MSNSNNWPYSAASFESDKKRKQIHGNAYPSMGSQEIIHPLIPNSMYQPL